jgi:hypothetical protein
MSHEKWIYEECSPEVPCKLEVYDYGADYYHECAPALVDMNQCICGYNKMAKWRPLCKKMIKTLLKEIEKYPFKEQNPEEYKYIKKELTDALKK